MSNNNFCFACRNCEDNSSDFYITIFRGYMICEDCLNDWIKDGQNNFELWCIQNAEKIMTEGAETNPKTKVSK